MHYSHTVTDIWVHGDSRKSLSTHIRVLFAKATTILNFLQPQQKHLQEAVGGTANVRRHICLCKIPTDVRHTLWSTGLRPCAVFPFLLCCELSQSYSTSGLLRSLQNVHIHSPLNRNKHSYSRYPGTKFL